MLMRTWDLTGIVGTGQSLSTGDQAANVQAAATTQAFGNLKLDLGDLEVPPFDAASDELSLVPLVEPLRPLAGGIAYPDNLHGETPHTSMANQISTLAAELGDEPFDTVHTAVGESGQGIDVINKTATDTGTVGRAYAATLFEAEAITRLADEAGQTYGVGAIIITHGEFDAGNTAYDDDLIQLAADYNEDLAAITGQTQVIPLFVSQQHSVPTGAGSSAASTVAQWQVGLEDPNIVCSGPKYQYPYVSDAIHMTAEGYELLGEKYGEVFFERVALGRDWAPLQPTSVEIDGTSVVIEFEVPVPPLVWDETLPPPHQDVPQWAEARGFEVSAAGAPVPIESVEIVGESIEITLGEDPSGSFVTVSYAHLANAAPMPGGTLRWGQLRDSDPFVGATTGEPQPNYAVAFAMTMAVN